MSCPIQSSITQPTIQAVIHQQHVSATVQRLSVDAVIRQSEVRVAIPPSQPINITIPRSIPGQNGREVELSTSATHIIRRYVGDDQWNNLAPIPQDGSKGDQGDQGPKGEQGLQGPVGATGPQGVTGPSAYQSYLDTTTDSPVMSVQERSKGKAFNPSQYTDRVDGYIYYGNDGGTVTRYDTAHYHRTTATGARADRLSLLYT